MTFERFWQQSSINNANSARAEGARADNAERERALVAEQADFDAKIAERRQDRQEQMNDTMTQVVTTLAQRHNNLLEENEELKAQLTQKQEELESQQQLLETWMLSQKAFRYLYRTYGRTEDGTPIMELPEEQYSERIEAAKKRIVAEERAEKLMSGEGSAE